MNDEQDPPPIATELEDSLRRLHAEIEWRLLGEEIRARRRKREMVDTAVEIMAAQETVSPDLMQKRARLLALLRDKHLVKNPAGDQ
jgi:hypothetical protein